MRKIKYSGYILNGEVNALSVSSNQIRNGKSKERKESSTVLTRRDPENLCARSSHWHQNLQKKHRKVLVLSTSMIVTKNNYFVTMEYIINNPNISLIFFYPIIS